MLPMCGFAGEFIFGGAAADIDLAFRMAQRLRHRGPDAAGAFISADERCAIGFRRLAIIDPAGSDQPMSLPGGRLTVAFNGEIYNFRQLREQLSADGAVFTSQGDTEVLLHLFKRHGPGMLEYLDGMFALAIYDVRESTLFLARDRLGQKPLWYAPLADRIVFASEPKALLLHPDVGRHVAFGAVSTYCSFGYVPAPGSIWKNICKLPPAHCLTASTSCSRPKQYWQLKDSESSQSSANPIEVVRQQLSVAVEARMIADVPLGALLSGGIDSAIIVALMCKAAGKSGGVRTFTAGFEDKQFDERPAAARVAKHCGTDHIELLVQPDVANMLDPLVDMYDEPFADSSALPTFLICQAARSHVTVALAGDGGDEVFAGYDRYRAMHLAETMSPMKYTALRAAAALMRPFASHDEHNRLRRLIRFADGIPQPPATQYLTYRSLFAPADLPRLFTDEFAAANDLEAPKQWFCDLYEQGQYNDETARAQHHDLLTYLPDDLLVKADIASMAASLELRAPMLDHRVVQLGLSLPTSLKIAGGRGKAVLRRAFGDILPPEVFSLPKRGFGIPLGRWLRENETLRETLCQTLLDGGLADRGIFRPESLAGLINDHISGRADHRHRLWALLVFARWLEKND